jgi:hypothetical protein
MEKLDKPCKRSGKTITHRVVCGKVQKMKGGALSLSDFRKREDDSEFKFDKIGFRPHIFFGEVEVDIVKYYKYGICNKEHIGNVKTCEFYELKTENDSISVVKTTGEEIIGENGNGNKKILYDLLSHLLYSKKLTDYKTIRRTIYDLLKNITFSNESLEKSLMIPEDFFKMDYLPNVITSNGVVPKGFYMNLPISMNFFMNPIETKTIEEIHDRKRGNIFKTHVYYYYWTNRLMNHKLLWFFSDSKNNDYYNLVFYSNETKNIYIAIYDHRNNIVNCYPIDLELYSMFSYPIGFIKLVKCLFLMSVKGVKMNDKIYSRTIINRKLQLNNKFNAFYRNKLH